jgi:hypothetical protein
MTASYNISFLGSPEQAESRVSKKGYRSSNYNNYMVEVVDFDNESHTYKVGCLLSIVFLLQVWATRHFQSLPPQKD